MSAGRRFLIGALVVVAGAAFLMIQGVRESGTYFLTPSELAERVAADSTFVNAGVKVGARVVPGSVQRDEVARTIAFRVTDGTAELPVTYRGLVPDTFTDQEEIEVIVEGRLGRDGVFQATDVLAKCGSRYESVPQQAA